jgi:mRNA-degrading endonuclease RelE of RelBE toxin-antitoxin system
MERGILAMWGCWAGCARLPGSIQKKVKQQIRLLAGNPPHPSLQTRPVQGASGIFDSRVDHAYRLTYERNQGDVLLLRAEPAVLPVCH